MEFAINKKIAYTREFQVDVMIGFLKEVGTLDASKEEIEQKYREFSMEKFDTSWIHPTFEMMVVFAKWLNNNSSRKE